MISIQKNAILILLVTSDGISYFGIFWVKNLGLRMSPTFVNPCLGFCLPSLVATPFIFILKDQTASTKSTLNLSYN